MVTTADDTVLHYVLLKKHMGQKLTELIDLVEELPVSSAKCEIGFIQMNLHHSSERNRLLVSSVNDTVTVSINGAPITA